MGSCSLAVGRDDQTEYKCPVKTNFRSGLTFSLQRQNKTKKEVT